MRVVARRNGANYQGQQSLEAEIDRHASALSRLAEQALQDDIDSPVCTLVLRSAKSAPAVALAQTQDALAASGVAVKAILTKVDPEQDLHAFFASLSALVPEPNLEAHVRWARNPRLMDAHEQAVYGRELCWTGDAVRRDADKRNRLVLFETCPDAVLRSLHAFKALWAASEPVPARLLDSRAGDDRPNAEAGTKNAPLAALVPPAEGWPLLRH